MNQSVRTWQVCKRRWHQ